MSERRRYRHPRETLKKIITRAKAIQTLYGGDPEFGERLVFYTSQSRIIRNGVNSGSLSAKEADIIEGTLKAGLARERDHDPLTDIYNRREIMRRLESEFAIATRSGRPLTIAMTDLDEFKAINDTYSHQHGDAVLVAVTSYLDNNIRISDIIGRWGGEELLMIFPDSKEREIAYKVDELRENMPTIVGESLERFNLNPPISRGITASFGIAQTQLNTVTTHMLISAADTALYRAKESGRNSVFDSQGNVTARLKLNDSS